MPTVTRMGRITAKANKTDQQFQGWLVREWSDGAIECYNATFNVWSALPAEWSKDGIRWATAAENAALAAHEAELDRMAGLS